MNQTPPPTPTPTPPPPAAERVDPDNVRIPRAWAEQTKGEGRSFVREMVVSLLDAYDALLADRDALAAEVEGLAAQVIEMDGIVAAAEARAEGLEKALRNAMGFLDTPIARRKLAISPDDEWLVEARALIDPALAARPVETEKSEEEPEKACPSCGCEETDHRGLLTCRCPAKPAPTPPAAAASEEAKAVAAAIRHLVKHSYHRHVGAEAEEGVARALDRLRGK